MFAGNSDIQWCFSQVKGTLDDDVTEADIISCVEFNQDGELLATGDKGGRVVIFQVKLNQNKGRAQSSNGQKYSERCSFQNQSAAQGRIQRLLYISIP